MRVNPLFSLWKPCIVLFRKVPGLFTSLLSYKPNEFWRILRKVFRRYWKVGFIVNHDLWLCSLFNHLSYHHDHLFCLSTKLVIRLNRPSFWNSEFKYNESRTWHDLHHSLLHRISFFAKIRSFYSKKHPICYNRRRDYAVPNLRVRILYNKIQNY